MLLISNDESDTVHGATPGSILESPDPTPGTSSIDDVADPFLPQISLNAMSGLPTLETFCVYGTVQNTRLTVLVDNESTHNFVQTHVAKFLGLSSL